MLPSAITSSIRYLLAPGNTRLANLLMIINTSPTSRIFFLGQIIVLNTCPIVTFDLLFVSIMLVDLIINKILS
jgi:hypothetical protein